MPNTEAPPKLTLGQTTEKEDLKLVIHDSPEIQLKKTVTENKPPEKKRILIAREPSKE